MATSMKPLQKSLRPGLAAGVVMLACGICLGAAPATPIAPNVGFKEVSHDNVTWSGGFWGKRLDIHQKTTIPHVLDKLEQRSSLRQFRRRRQGGLRGKAIEWQ